MTFSIKTIIFTTVFIGLATAVSAYNFSFRKHQVNHGLSGNTVHCILQDNQGFMWFGTQDGLNRFDGSNYKIFKNDPNNAHSLGNNFIRSLYQHPNNEIWVGTDHRIFIFDPETEDFHQFINKTDDGISITSAVTSIEADNEHSIWIGTMSQGAFSYHTITKKLTQYKSNDGSQSIPDNLVWRIYKDNSGTVWIGTRSGLSRFNKESNTFITYGSREKESVINDPEILSIFEDSDGDIWLGTWSGGLSRYNKTTNTFTSYFKEQDEVYITHIRTFHEYEKGKLLIGSDDGLYLLNKKSLQIQRIDDSRDQNSLSDQNIYAIYGDKEGGLWIGTYFGGVNYLSPNSNVIEHYYPNYKESSMSGKAVSQFLEDSKGNLWIATEDGGLNYFNTTTKEFTTHLPHEDKQSLSYTNLHSLLLDGNKLWIGTFSRGLDVMDLKTGLFTNYQYHLNDTNSIDDDCIFALYQTKNNNIYIGTPFGLSRYNRQQNNFERIKEIRGFIYDIIEDHIGHLWVASYGQGVYKHDTNSKVWHNYRHKNYKDNSLCFDKIVDVFQDEKQRLWFSSEGGGICKYNYETNDFTTFDMSNGLPNNVVYGALDDKYGNIWMSTNKGIAKFDPSSLKIKTFTSEDGLQSNQFNYRSSLKASNGKFYFGGINGFNAFYPHLLKENEYVPPVLVTRFKLLDADKRIKKDSLRSGIIHNNKQITLKYYQSSFQIDFVSLSFMAQGKNEFSYLMENLNEKWIEAGNQTNVSYINLKPGDYVFRVRGSNNDGLWNEEGDFLRIKILPPIWLSDYAYLFYLLLSITIAYYLYKINQKRILRKQKQKLEDFEAEKEKEMYASKINFFTNIAHEIRTPVSLIKAPLDSILQENKGSAESKENLAVIDKNTDRLINLINQLLDFRKIEAEVYVPNYELTNIKGLISDVIYRFKTTASKNNISINTILSKNEMFYNVDKESITKIISNLITNALKYAKKVITIKLVEPFDEDYFEIVVEDDGPGVPEKYRERVFEPFFQLKENENTSQNKGTGIGLAFSRQLAEKNKGSLFVRNNEQKSSEFVLQVNKQLQNMEEHFMQQEKLTNDLQVTDKVIDAPIYAGKPTLLIVEDNEDLSAFLNRSLKMEYKVITAANGQIALDILENQWVDIIISDVMMPGIDGLELVKKTKESEQYSHIPIILLSAHTNLETKVTGLDYGADSYIEKPFSLEYLRAQVKSLVKNRNLILEKFATSPFVPYGSIANNKKDEEFLNKLNNEIEINISDSAYSIEKLAAALSMSRSNLQRKIKGISGMSPNDYIRVFKLKKATKLIMEGKYRINEICYLVGFNSPSYFSKCFQKQFGILPSEFANEAEEYPKQES